MVESHTGIVPLAKQLHLQVMLLLVESAHSGPARKMLNRYAQGLASALMSHVLTHKAQTPKGIDKSAVSPNRCCQSTRASCFL